MESGTRISCSQEEAVPFPATSAPPHPHTATPHPEPAWPITAAPQRTFPAKVSEKKIVDLKIKFCYNLVILISFQTAFVFFVEHNT